MLQKEQPIARAALLGDRNQINQKLDSNIEEKLKIEIKKDEEKEEKKQTPVAAKKEDTEEDEHLDDLPY